MEIIKFYYHLLIAQPTNVPNDEEKNIKNLYILPKSKHGIQAT